MISLLSKDWAVNCENECAEGKIKGRQYYCRNFKFSPVTRKILK